MSTASKKSKKDAKNETKSAQEEKSESDAPVIVDNANFKLERYINQYNGLTRIKRLLWIGQHTKGELQVNAFRQAIDEAKQGLNYPMYEDCVRISVECIGGKLGDKYLLDNVWVDTIRRQGHAEFTRLDTDLKDAKHIGEREPTRIAYNRVADHQMKQGDLQKALNNYQETKEYGNSIEHKMETCFNIINAAIALGTFAHIKGQANRVQGIISGNSRWKSQISAALGLYYLKQGNFLSAATQFFNCTVELGTSFNHIISIKDIAIYGSFCALAAFNRPRLKGMLEAAVWKKFLELVPTWKKIIVAFANSSYADCFKLISLEKNRMLLDMYISPHFFQLEKLIRDRAFQQYFRPFKSVKIPSMARAFDMEIQFVEKYLVTLIADNKIQGRIDSHNKILLSRVADQRSVTYQESLDLGNRYVRDVKSLLMRMSLIKADFVVRPNQVKRGHGARILSSLARGHGDDDEKKRPEEM